MKKRLIQLLFLEDNPDDVRLMIGYLNSDDTLKFEVRQVSSLADGLSSLAESTPDIILADLGLSDSQGLDTFKKLHAAAQQIPIIVLTGITDPLQAAQVVNAGAQDYLNKNEVNSGFLCHAIRYAIERKQAVEDIKQNEERFRLMFENAPVGYQSLDSKGCFLDVNNTFLDLLGYTRQEVIGRRFSEFLHPDQVTLFDERFPILTKSREVLTDIEFTLRRRDGSFMEASFTTRLVRDEAGRFIRTHSALQDISTRKQSERAILLMTETQRQIATQTRVIDVFTLVGTRIQELIGDGYVLISQLDESSESTHVIGVYGNGDQFDKLSKKFNIDISHMSFSFQNTPPEDLHRFRSGKLELFEDGIFRLLLKKIPKRVSTILEKELELSGVYTIGFVWDGIHHGGLTILAKYDLEPFREMIETTVNQATLAIERIQSQEALSASEERYRMLAETSPEMIFVIDREDQVQYVNNLAARQFGKTPEQVIGKPRTELFPPAIAESQIHALRQVLRSGEVLTSESLTNFPGRQLWLDTQLVPLRDKSGQVNAVMGVSRDISERRQADQQLRLQAAALESAANAIVITDRHGSIQWINPAYERLTGYSLQEAIGLNPRILKSGLQSPEFYRNLWDTVLSGKVWQAELVNKRKDGSLYNEEETITPLLDEKGEITHFIGIKQDVTRRKEAERELKESEAKLRESQSVSRIGSYVLDIPTNMWTSSEVLDELFGIEQDYIKTLESWNGLVHPDEQQEMLAYFTNEVVGNRKRFNKEYRIIRPSDGEVRWMWGLGSLNFDTDGVPQKMIGTIQDITQRKQAEIARQESHSLLQATLESTADGILVVDLQGNIKLTNQNFADMWGLSRDQLEGNDVSVSRNHILKDLKDPQAFLEKTQAIYADITAESFDEIELKNGRVLERVSWPQYHAETIVGRVSSFRDVSEQKKIDKMIRTRLELAEFSATHSTEDILRKTLDVLEDLTGSSIGFFHFVEDDQETILLQAWSTRTEQEYCLAKGLGSHYPVSKAGVWSECVHSRQPTIHNDYATLPNRKGLPEGHASLVRELVIPILKNDKVVAILGMGNKEQEYTREDVEKVSFLAESAWEFAARNKAEARLLESEAKYRSLFDNVPDGVYRSKPDGQILAANKMLVSMLGFENEESLIKAGAYQVYDTEAGRDMFLEEINKHGVVKNLEVQLRTAQGKSIVGLENTRAYRDENGEVIFYEGTLTDITERKQVEIERQILLEIMQGFTATEDLQKYLEVVHHAIDQVTYAKNFFIALKNKKTGLFEITYTVDEFDENISSFEMGRSLSAYVFRSAKPYLFDPVSFDDLVARGLVESIGAYSPSWLGVPLIISNETIGVMVVQDYHTKDRYSEHDLEILNSISGQVAQAIKRKSSEAELEELFEIEKRRSQRLSDLQVLSAELNSLHTEQELLERLVEKAALLSNSPVCTVMLLDQKTDEIILSAHYGLPASFPGHLRIPVSKLPGAAQAFKNGESILISNIDQDLPALRAVLVHPQVQAFFAFPLVLDGMVAGAITLSSLQPRQLSEAEVGTYQLLARLASTSLDNVRLFEGVNRSLQRMSSLRRVDMAISASFDLVLTLNILLEQVTTNLGVDAADILVFDPSDSTLKYTCGRGFRSQALRYTNLRIGEGFAGQAALERRTIYIPDLQEEMKSLERSMSLPSEGFVSYWGVPLLAKGNIQGVLEVFHRQPIPVDQDWINFMETLAGQAAIAVDNVLLFNHLERSNADLSMAYDSTLTGWATALELRDNETEGHTSRVAVTTTQLAVKMGVHDKEIMFMRWGSLLHDIGKMGIPDSILLKPGPLSEEEWVIMRTHPVLAYEMLSPIDYLGNALDIPYSHHEKWDGSGYPRGLKGEQIPLSARIFAIIDVWDALTSDRPYRAAWSAEKTVQYIREQIGTHFDPRVGEAFLEMIGTDGKLPGA